MTTPQTRLSTPVTDTLNRHVSIRHYTDQPIPDEMLHSIIEAARRGAPTSSNLQTYSLVVVRDPDTKQKLAELAGGQKHVAACPVFIAAVADLSRVAHAAAMHGVPLGENLEMTLYATVDAALVGMTLCTAAESFGLGTVMIGGMRNKPQEVAQLLGLPPRAYVVYGICLGYPLPERVPSQKARLPHEVVVHYERYEAGDLSAHIAAYDAELAAHYRAEGRNTPDAAWSSVVANNFSKPPRPHLRAALERMGMRFGSGEEGTE